MVFPLRIDDSRHRQVHMCAILLTVRCCIIIEMINQGQYINYKIIVIIIENRHTYFLANTHYLCTLNIVY